MKTIIPVEIVPLGEDESYHLFVKGSINGIACNLLIDTGASQTVFDLSLIPKTTGKRQKEIQSSGILAGEMETAFGCINKFKLGGLKCTNLEVVLIDLTHVNETYRRLSSKQAAGLIGSDFLLRYNAVINYRKRHLILRK
ncbi:MAG: retropepsin-like domain-containing protein [Bacteroidales bacterium]|jgi:predicted aspartyl protease|nr:retropepsin-like domain-containing protein [Bacteroidales bacterium]